MESGQDKPDLHHVPGLTVGGLEGGDSGKLMTVHRASVE